MNGFEMLQKLSSFPKVIFGAAFDEYVLKAFESHCIDYLIKPLTKEHFVKTVEKRNSLSNKSSNLNLNKLIEQLAQENKKSEATTIPVKLSDKIIFIRLNEVSYFKADERYVSLVTKQTKEYILDLSLKKLQDKIPGYFIRVHKSYIVNKDLLKEVRKHYRELKTP